MHAIDLSAISDDSRKACESIAAEAGVDLKDCYQCGKCTAGCPLAESMDLVPREVIRYLQLGAIDVVLEAKTPRSAPTCWPNPTAVVSRATGATASSPSTSTASTAARCFPLPSSKS